MPGLKLEDAKTILLETYRKAGTPVGTPVWLFVEGGTVYVRTDPMSGKAKRLRNNPHVRFAPCDFRGNLEGDWAEGEASFVNDEEAARVMGLFKKKYGLTGSLIGLGRRLRGAKYVVIAIKPSST